MAFKNAFKIFVNRFGLAWSLCLFLILFALILGTLGLTVIIPVFRAFSNAGIVDRIGEIFGVILDGSGATANIGAEIQIVWSQILALFQDDRRLTVTTTTAFFAVVLVYKFLLGFYELPAYQALEGAMSAGARYGFTGAFVSKLGLSSRFVLVKIIYTTLYDAAFYGILYLLLGLFFVPGGAVIAPVVIFLYFLVFQALRYTPLAFWGPAVVVSKAPIFQSFGFSLNKSMRHFGSVFLSFLFAWAIILPLNLFIGIFTFGVGLIATIPASMLFICILNMTLFYGKTGRRYYADEQIITPISNGAAG